MDNPATSIRGPSANAGNGANRPLPPIPDPELDLYSAGEEVGRQRSFSQPEASTGIAEELQIHESQGESSHSASMNMNNEALSSRRNLSDVKGSGGNSMRVSEELVGDASQSEFAGHLSRIRSISSPIQNNRHQNSFPQPTYSSEGPRERSQGEVDDMSFPGSNRGQPPGSRRVQHVRIMPGTVNYSAERGQTNPQYQFVGERVILPRWQPDSEVSTCPICHSLFNVFNRKHHCRKCGKVVCGSCSPHRITIPREYIVSPQPGVQASPPRNPRTSNASISRDGSIEGGERVRLCNPCVPDPNTAPPQGSPPPPYASGPSSSNERQVNPEDRLPMFSEYRAPPGNSYHPPPHGPRSAHMPNELINYLQDLEVQSRSNARRPQLGSVRTASQASGVESMYPQQSQVPNREASQRSGAVHNNLIPAPPDSLVMATVATTRRNIPEEDICPVCGGVYSAEIRGNEAQKELHVQRCIEDLSARNRNNSQGQIAGPPGARPVGQSSTHMRRGMTRYTATARDAVDGEECQICLEDFLPSQELARLTCLCRYHSECILNWWDHRQFGKCPTHDHGL